MSDTRTEQEINAYEEDKKMANERLSAIKEMQDMAYKLRCEVLETIKMESDIKDKVTEIMENFELELYHLEDEEKKRIDEELKEMYQEGYQEEHKEAI